MTTDIETAGHTNNWEAQADTDALQDAKLAIFDGQSPDRLACDTTLRAMPDGSWVMVMLGGGDSEPLPQNRFFLTRSWDEGHTWSDMQPLDLGIKQVNPRTALVPSELMVHQGRCTLFVATHDGTFGNWQEWMTHSHDSGHTWSDLEPAPGKLCKRTFIRNHIVTRDDRILLPFQHYLDVDERARTISGNRLFSRPHDPRNGVLISENSGKTWHIHGDVRISDDDDYHGWAENNIVELADGTIAMIIRADGTGILYYAESKDGGRTWPQFAQPTDIPNPGSKATLYGLGGNTVALLHNPNPERRTPLSLWISFDGLKTWPYRRILVEESCDGPGGNLNYPDGFVNQDKTYLHFAFDDNRHRAVLIRTRLPALEPSEQ